MCLTSSFLFFHCSCVGAFMAAAHFSMLTDYLVKPIYEESSDAMVSASFACSCCWGAAQSLSMMKAVGVQCLRHRQALLLPMHGHDVVRGGVQSPFMT